MHQKMIYSKLVSVIIPVYNVEKYLPQCIDSVRNQTYKNLEIILINDGSSDKSGEICEKYSKTDSRIYVIHKENGGLSDARNAGLDYASGEYIFFLDSDDFIDLKTIDCMLHYLIKTKSDMALCNIQYVDETGQMMPKQDLFRDFHVKDGVWTQSQFWNCCYKRGHIVCTVQWNKLYKRKLFKNVRYPSGKVREDEFVIHQIVNQCNRIACVSESLHYYRQRSKSIMSNAYSIEQLDIIEAYVQRERAFLKNGNIKLAKKTLMRAIIFLEWFSIGMDQEQKILKRYSCLKKRVCCECKNVLKKKKTLLFWLEVQMYLKGILPYKPLRTVYWKINQIKNKSHEK